MQYHLFRNLFVSSRPFSVLVWGLWENRVREYWEVQNDQLHAAGSHAASRNAGVGERVHYRGLTDETSSCDPFICFRGCAFILWHADGQIIATLSGRESEKILNKLMI